jgi:hypothetical protein
MSNHQMVVTFYYKTKIKLIIMSKIENLMPEEYWNELSDTDKDALLKAQLESDVDLQTGQEWEEMNDEYYEHLRGRFGKGPDEIGPRDFKTFKGNGIPIWMMVIPAGKQSLSSSPEIMTQHFHTICEDMELGECNGSYELITEEELESKFNIKYNN